jgi:CRP-like cAMP-binding protein
MHYLTLIDPSWFARGALVCYVLGLLMRDGLGLRLFLLAGTSCYIAYYFTASTVPLWEAIYASACIFAANTYAIFRSVSDRTTWLMSAQQRSLFGHFPNLSPGQFRRMMRAATEHEAEHTVTLCRQGVVPDQLVFVQTGPVYLLRGEQITRIEGGKFIGEIAFLRGPKATATATVALGKGARYLRWDRDKLYRMMADSVPMANALAALFNHDMCLKLEQSWPQPPALRGARASDKPIQDTIARVA